MYTICQKFPRFLGFIIQIVLFVSTVEISAHFNTNDQTFNSFNNAQKEKPKEKLKKDCIFICVEKIENNFDGKNYHNIFVNNVC